MIEPRIEISYTKFLTRQQLIVFVKSEFCSSARLVNEAGYITKAKRFTVRYTPFRAKNQISSN